MSHETTGLHDALVKAAEAMPVLKKGERNAHGNYNYVGVDTYFELAGKVAQSYGLCWTLRELSCDVVQIGEKNGSPVMAFKTKYAVDLYHSSGQDKQEFFSATILHPLQGAQTAGSAMSYANKMFLRNTFALVTGEEDADQTDNGAFDLGAAIPKPEVRRAAGPPKAADPAPAKGSGGRPDQREPEDRDPKAVAEWVKQTVQVWLPAVASLDDLNNFWVENEKTFAWLKEKSPEQFAWLRDAFSARKKELG